MRTGKVSSLCVNVVARADGPELESAAEVRERDREIAQMIDENDMDMEDDDMGDM